MPIIDNATRRRFQGTVWEYYRSNARHDLLWRQPAADGRFDPYVIMVSELMLQQTQVSRVIPKYHDFLGCFPTLEALAVAPLGEVLRAWNGLGYNRRAKYLHQAAQKIVGEYNGQFPTEPKELIKLPCIGSGTAGAILAYAYNQPVIFIETNIRTVFIHHFFNDQANITDKQLEPFVKAMLDQETPREWYWALMDYGSYLKRSVGNRSRQSKSYAKQSRFEGSSRQIRGQIIHSLTIAPKRKADLQKEITDPRLDTVLADLLAEGMIQRQANHFRL